MLREKKARCKSGMHNAKAPAKMAGKYTTCSKARHGLRIESRGTVANKEDFVTTSKKNQNLKRY